MRIATRRWFQPIWTNIPQIGSFPQIRFEKTIKYLWNHHPGLDPHTFLDIPFRVCLEASHILVDFFWFTLNHPCFELGSIPSEKKHVGESCQNDEQNQGHLGGSASIHNQDLSVLESSKKNPTKKSFPKKSAATSRSCFCCKLVPCLCCLTPPNLRFLPRHVGHRFQFATLIQYSPIHGEEWT